MIIVIYTCEVDSMGNKGKEKERKEGMKREDKHYE